MKISEWDYDGYTALLDEIDEQEVDTLIYQEVPNE